LTPSTFTPTITHDVLATPLDQLLRRASQYQLLDPAKEIELADSKAKVQRQTEAGYDVVEAPLPAVVRLQTDRCNARISTLTGSKSYGTTKRGAYMCEKDAIAGENRASKNERRAHEAGLLSSRNPSETERVSSDIENP